MHVFDNIVLEKKSAIAYITVNRPKVLNALNQATLIEIEAAIRDIGSDPSVRGVIMTGSGEKAFVAGADIRELAELSAIQALDFARRGQHVTERIEQLGKPVIAAVNGLALGGGCEIAMACTMRLSIPSARFGQPEVKLGVIAGFGGTQRLAHLVGKGRALQILLTGDPIDAHEAYRIGLVNELVEPQQLIARAEELLRKIEKNAPIAIRLSLDAVNDGLQVSQTQGLILERTLFAVCTTTADRKEGMSAFLEKRPASFIGQ